MNDPVAMQENAYRWPRRCAFFVVVCAIIAFPVLLLIL
jgi:hypothetical protein